MKDFEIEYSNCPNSEYQKNLIRQENKTLKALLINLIYDVSKSNDNLLWEEQTTSYHEARKYLDSIKEKY